MPKDIETTPEPSTAPTDSAALQTLSSMKPFSILFVCLGNICRSPAAEGILQQMAKSHIPPLNIEVKSCGLGDWHEGQLPDERMRQAAKERGVALTSRAQAFHESFFRRFDAILVADNSVLHELYKLSTSPEDKAKVHLMTKHSALYPDQEVPDPYYGTQGHFEVVLDMLEDACHGIIKRLTEKDKL